MGLFTFLKKQFIDVIEWTEPGDGILSYKFPMQDNEIQTGAVLTVRDSQMAMFVNEGKIADAFGPGRHKLSTNTLPLLTNLNNWDKLFASPFKSDVYFFSTREQIDQRWGTPTPITIRDKEYGPLRIRANGSFSYKIADPKKFYQKISGTRDVYTSEELGGQLRAAIITNFGSMFGGSDVGFVDMASNQVKFSVAIGEAMKKPFGDYGLEVASFFVQSISLPEELQQRMDKASSMRLLGDLQQYAQFQTAEAIATAAANEGGGAAGAGVGLGAGMALGQTMAAAMTGASRGGGATEEDPLQTIDKLHGLLQKGVITQAEFDSKKAELLKKVK
ncbi:MAG: SPFH domain-containing protein [Bdellovibrionia bacterium]